MINAAQELAKNYTGHIPSCRVSRIFVILLIMVLAASVGLAIIYQPVPSIIISLVLIFLILIFFKPVAGFYISLAFANYMNIYFNVNQEKESIKIVFFIILFTYIVWLIYRIARVEDKAPDNPLNIYAMFFLIYSAVSLFWSLDVYRGGFKLFDLFIAIIMLQMPLLFIRDTGRLKTSLKAIFAAGSIGGLLVFISKRAPGHIRIPVSENVEITMSIIRDKLRAAGFAPPDVSGSVLNFSIFIGIALLLTTKSRFLKVVYSGLIMFQMIDVVMTGSKASFGTLFMGLLFLILITPMLRKKMIACTCIVILTISLAFVAGAMFSAGSLSKARVVASTGGTTQSLSSRMGWWSKGFDYLDKTQFIGVGMGGGYQLIKPVRSFHSLYFSVLFELGIIGMSVFVMMMIWLVYASARIVYMSRGDHIFIVMYCVIAALFTFFVHSLVGGEFSVIQFWWEAGIILAIMNIAGILDVVKRRHRKSAEMTAAGAL